MEKGVSLVELLIAMFLSSILLLILYQFNQMSSAMHRGLREEWYCMQSLRRASLQLNADIVQNACLLPQNLKIAVMNNHLFIAGIPVTSEHPGIRLIENNTPPYYALIMSSAAWGAVLDTIDMDNDGLPDFWADLGMITDSGPCVISHNYSRGSNNVFITFWKIPIGGDRAVPAFHYELKDDGLYRNNQLLAEALVLFNPKISGNELTIDMRSQYHETQKKLLLSYPIQ
ncbi:MAG TPA: prepilin-type N-terminal cleavage/methylation domain-containing protein [Desulfomonilia bacterium]|nr:prepilin-type N-terminal cleavage/methylation domain-containing protein [Desulfomonilia bacterium]